MMLKKLVMILCLFTLSFATWAGDKKYNFVSQNKEGDFLTATYFDPDQKELLIRVFKTKEGTLELPTVVKGPLELTPKGKYTVADDREFDLATDKGKQGATTFINRYNKDQAFLTSVSQATRKDCTVLSSVAPLPGAGNAQSLTSLSLQIADQIATQGDKIVFRVDLADSHLLMSSQLNSKGDIISLEFADGTTEASRKSQTIVGGKFANKKLEIVGPQNNAAYLKLENDPVLKVTTENFTKSGGDFIVTTVDPTPTRAEFVENLYQITISGNKLTVSPRQIIASELDFSNELKPSDGIDEKPTALGFQNFLANMVWGGGKDKTEKEIVKAGKEAVKSDPLLKQYLTEQDVEKIAKKIIADGYVINKDAISEKPKLMGVAYLYFSEELLKKAIMEQMPMSEAELQPMVDEVMANFRACIKEAKYSGGVEDCKNKFAKTAVVKIARNIMYQQIDQNLGPSVSGPNAKEQIAEAKKKSDVEYARCINKYFTIPYEEAEKAKKPLPDSMKIGVSCVYTSVQYAANLVVSKELENTFKSMGIYKPGDDLVLSSIQKSSSGCYQQMGITVDTIGRRYDMNKLQKQTTDDFKASLIGCVNNHIKAGGRVAVQRTIENNPDLNSIMKSANVPETQRAEFVQKILSTGYDRCMVDLEKVLPKGSVLNPTNCEGYITLKAKEDAFRMILKKELSTVKTKPSPWETEIDPALSRCTNNFFASYMTRKDPPLTEKDLTVCFRDAISSAGFYIGGELLNQEVVENPAIKSYGLKLSDSDKTKYQNMIKVCMGRELQSINKVEELTAVNSKSKKTNLDTIKDKCTIEVAQSLVPNLAKDILKIEMRKAIASEKPEDKAKLEAELDKIIDPVIKAELLPRMAKIQNMDDVTSKVLPAFTTEATLKAAGTILDFKLSSFATNPEGKRRMAQVRDTLVSDLRKEISGGKSLSPAIMNKVESKAIVLVTNTMIDQYFGKKYPRVAKALISSLDPNFVKALTEVKFVGPKGSGGKSDKPMDIESLANTLGQYIDEALKYDPSIVDAVKDLQKKILADINAQKRAGKTPTLSVDQLLKDYWKHPAFKKIILSQVSKELSAQFGSNLINAKQLEAMFSTPQGEKALASIRDNMLIPMINGKEPTAQNKAAYTLEVAQLLVPDLAKDILKNEMRKAIASEKPEDRAKLEAELDKIIDPLIKTELLPRMAKIQSMDDLTKKVLPAFTTEATLRAAGTILDFKLSSFATNPEGKKRMAQVRDTLVNDLKKEISGGKSLSPAIMSKVESKAITLVTNSMIDQYFGKKYPQVAKVLVSSLDPNFVKALTEVKFVAPKGAGGKSDKPMDIAGLANTLGQYIDEALKYDPSIVDAVKDLQKKILADINAQKRAGKTPTLSVDQLLKDYWKHPAFKKIILSQVSKELRTQFATTLKQMEADDMRTLTEPSNADLIKTKYTNLRSLVTTTTSAKQLEAMFSTPQGEKALASIRDNMLVPMLNGKEATANNKAAYTLEVAKTLTGNRAPGSFAERFAAHNLQAELTADKRSRGAVVKGIMEMLGYKIENYEWDNLRKTPSGQKALNYFNDQILLPSMTGQKINLDAKKAALKEMIKEGLKGK